MAAISIYNATLVAPVPLTALIQTIATAKNINAKSTIRKHVIESLIIIWSEVKILSI